MHTHANAPMAVARTGASGSRTAAFTICHPSSGRSDGDSSAASDALANRHSIGNTRTAAAVGGVVADAAVAEADEVELHGSAIRLRRISLTAREAVHGTY